MIGISVARMDPLAIQPVHRRCGRRGEELTSLPLVTRMDLDIPIRSLFFPSELRRKSTVTVSRFGCLSHRLSGKALPASIRREDRATPELMGINLIGVNRYSASATNVRKPFWRSWQVGTRHLALPILVSSPRTPAAAWELQYVLRQVSNPRVRVACAYAPRSAPACDDRSAGDL